MKRTAIIAMLVVFALVATPLWTMNAKAEIVDDPAVIDTTGADWDYRVYGDANGYIIMVDRNAEIHGEDGNLVGYNMGWWGKCNGGDDGVPSDESKGFSSLIRAIIGGEFELNSDSGDYSPSTGADWDYRVYGDANVYIILVDRNNEIHVEEGGMVCYNMGWWGKCHSVYDDANGYIIMADRSTEIHDENSTEPARMGGKIALCNCNGELYMVTLYTRDGEFHLDGDGGVIIILKDGSDGKTLTGEDGGAIVDFVVGDDQQPIILSWSYQYCLVIGYGTGNLYEEVQ